MKDMSLFKDITSGVEDIAGLFASIGAKKRQKDLLNYQAQLQYDYGERAAANAYERQIEAWNMQNAYNTPAAQRQRLEEAGLHGASLFAGASPGEASQLPSVGMGATGSGASLQLQSNPVMSSILQGIQVAQSLANLDLTKSQTDKNNAQAATESYRQASIQTDTALKNVYKQHEEVKMSVTKINEEIQQATKQAQIDAAWFATAQGRLSIKTSEQNLLNLAEQYKALQNKNELFGIEKQQAQLQLSQMAQQIALHKALQRLYDSRTDLTNWEKQKVSAEIQEVWSRISLNRTQESLNWAYEMESNQRGSKASSEKDLLDKQVDWFDSKTVNGMVNDYLSTLGKILAAFVSAGR